MDLISVHPVFSLYNRTWSTMAMIDGAPPPARFVYGEEHSRMGHAIGSFVLSGIIISSGEVYHSIVLPNCYIHPWAQVTGSVVMHGCRIDRHSAVSKAILDKNIVLEEGVTVGLDLEHDRQCGLTVTDLGITIIPKSMVITH